MTEETTFSKLYISNLWEMHDKLPELQKQIKNLIKNTNDKMKTNEEQKLTNNCPKCGLDLIIREGSTPNCTRIDCGGIVISNETLKEWMLNTNETK